MPWLAAAVLLVVIASVHCVPAVAAGRVALVIGNSLYRNAPALHNPSNDGSDVAAALRSVGFDVISAMDATKRDMDRSIVQFSRKAADADVALFYFAGHGLQFQGRNYLVPVDAELQDQISVRYETVDLDDIKSALDGSRAVKLLILDACRNNPLAEQLSRSLGTTSRGMSLTRGLAPTEKTGGMLVIYATQSNATAADGEGRNSPFSTAFLDQIKVPGLEASVLFRRVSAEVYRNTSGRQEPEISISNFPDLFLNQADTDATIWARIRSAPTEAALRDFLTRFPDSFFQPEAKLRLEVLERDLRDREKADQDRKLAEQIALLNQQRADMADATTLRERALATKLADAERQRQQMADEVEQLSRERSSLIALKSDKDAAVARAQSDVEAARLEQAAHDAASKAAADRERGLMAEIARLEASVATAKSVNDHLAAAGADALKLNEVQARAAALAERLKIAEADRQRSAAEIQQLDDDRKARQKADEDRQSKIQTALLAAEQARRDADMRDDQLKQAAEREHKLAAEIGRLRSNQQDTPARTEQKAVASLGDPAQPAAAVPSASGPSTALTPEQLGLVPPILGELRRIGCYSGADLAWDTPKLQQALLRFLDRANRPVPVLRAPTEALLADLKSQNRRVCPTLCGTGTVDRDGICVARPSARPDLKAALRPEARRPVRPGLVQPAGREPRLPKDPLVAGREPVRPRVVRDTSPPRASSSNCFSFNGKQFCE